MIRQLAATALLVLGSLSSFNNAAEGQQSAAIRQTLLKNVNIFNGNNDKLITGQSVLIEGRLIKTIGTGLQVGAEVGVIDGGGKTLMPGLIDGHAHIAYTDHKVNIEQNYSAVHVGVRMPIKARNYLMDGFTSVRDVGGPSFAMKDAVDSGLYPGPRIYPAGAIISQTSGHGDTRAYKDPNPTLDGHNASTMAQMGYYHVVDGRPAVLAATRQNLMQGASHIKMMGGGGGSSKYDPIDVTQFTEDETRAIVEAAADWGTYVTAHIFTPRAIKRAINAGVKSLEHAFFVDESTVKLIAKEGVFVVPQTWGLSPELFRHPGLAKSKHQAIKDAHDKAKNFAPWLLKHKVKVVFASDDIGPYAMGVKSRRYELHWRAELFGSNFEVLKQATSVAGELLALSGPRNPYPGKLGVVEEGALADLLLVDGNPLEDLSVLGASPEWFDAPEPQPIDTLRLIMKDGVIYKNTL